MPVVIDGQVVGAVGVGGGSGEQDAEVARAGVRALLDALALRHIRVGEFDRIGGVHHHQRQSRDPHGQPDSVATQREADQRAGPGEPGRGGSGHAAEGADDLFFIVGLFACVLAHEFGHILTGRAFGIATPEVILLPIGGVAHMSNIPQSAPKELLIAAAGPVVNIVIAVALVVLFGAHLAFKDIVSGDDVVVPMLGRLATANVVLAVFNLTPIPPLDGSHVFKYILPPAWALSYERISRYGLLIVCALLFFGSQLLNYWLLPATSLTTFLAGSVSSFVLPWQGAL